MKRTIPQRIRACGPCALVIYILFAVAFCNQAEANSLENMKNSELQRYTLGELQRGAPSLHVPSRVLYREALETLEAGDWKQAREKLLFCASLSADYPDPMFTLARIELFHAHPDFMYHMFEGMKRLTRSFYRQALLGANITLFVITSSIISLFFILVVLLIKYWFLIDHKIREVYSRKHSFPPARFIGLLAVLGLLVMRLGIAAYTVILILVTWSFLSRREKGGVLVLAVFISALSFLSPMTNIFITAIDEGSVTRRLSLINESGANNQLLHSINTIEDPRFIAEREYALGTLMYRLGMYDEAREHLLASVSRRSDFAPAYLNLGNVYFMQGDYNKALAGYQNVIAIDSTSSVAYFNIGQTYINKMLFAESSSALKKAGVLGIENYRAVHPAALLREASVYDEGFPAGELWSIAMRESVARDKVIIARILRPWLLFPFRWLGWLLISSLLVVITVGRKFPGKKDVFRCDNCGKAACIDCVNDEAGINLCRGCSDVIKGLSSIKVMEALLRHRRQKISAKRASRSRLKMILTPWGSYLWYGRTVSGVFASLVNFSAILSIFWSGMYFKDPRVLTPGTAIWGLLLPAIVLLLGYIASMRIKPTKEQKNFRILPADFRVEEPPETVPQDPFPGIDEGSRETDRFEQFLNSL